MLRRSAHSGWKSFNIGTGFEKEEGASDKLLRNHEFRLSLFLPHNLKVVGSNPTPATKKYRVVKRLSAALRGGVCVSSSRGSTVEARGDEVFRRSYDRKLVTV